MIQTQFKQSGLVADFGGIVQEVYMSDAASNLF